MDTKHFAAKGWKERVVLIAVAVVVFILAVLFCVDMADSLAE